VEPVAIHAPDPEGVVFIPVFSQTAAAGTGQEITQLFETEGMMPVLYDLLGVHRPEHCGICRVVGDSMTDITLSNGDWALFDRHDIRGDGIFVISMFGEIRVKRLQYRLADRKVIIASENAKRYPDHEIVGADAIERGELRIHGRVFSWMHRHPY
jgi:phage repressor protein C with HTH and peptisase S24 domain